MQVRTTESSRKFMKDEPNKPLPMSMYLIYLSIHQSFFLIYGFLTLFLSIYLSYRSSIDFIQYPGKMDHATVCAFRVGKKTSPILKTMSSPSGRKVTF